MLLSVSLECLKIVSSMREPSKRQRNNYIFEVSLLSFSFSLLEDKFCFAIERENFFAAVNATAQNPKNTYFFCLVRFDSCWQKMGKHSYRSFSGGRKIVNKGGQYNIIFTAITCWYSVVRMLNRREKNVVVVGIILDDQSYGFLAMRVSSVLSLVDFSEGYIRVVAMKSNLRITVKLDNQSCGFLFSLSTISQSCVFNSNLHCSNYG